MASWTVPLRTEAVDINRDAGLYWEDINSASTDDPTGDFFGQFVNFDAEGHGTDHDFDVVAASMPDMAESLLLIGEHGHSVLDSTLSSGVSSGDEFDFLSSSSHIGGVAPTHEIDPKDLALSADDLLVQQQQQQQYDYFGRGSMSEADLTRLESICLHSPHKPMVAASDPPSPTPDARKPKKFVEALSSTLKKATTLRKNKKMASAVNGNEVSRNDNTNTNANSDVTGFPGSPFRQPHQRQQQQQPQPLKIPKQRRVNGAKLFAHPASPPIQHQDANFDGDFVHGRYDDPFKEPLHPPHLGPYPQFYGQVAPDTPIDSPGVKSEPGQGRFPYPDRPQQPEQEPEQDLQQPGQPPQQLHWTGSDGDYVMAPGYGGWWNPNMINPALEHVQQQHHPTQQQHQQQHQQQQQQQHHAAQQQAHPVGMGYDYMDPSTGGLMIHMPQPRGSQSTIVNDLTANARALVPSIPLPPPPSCAQQSIHASADQRSHRPPRAKSSGARHLSNSPVRRARVPSASPGPGDVPRSRHSSGASVSSVRSASGRFPSSMPGTPCHVRKRRSRDASGDSNANIGFVNFTPSDGGVLMTGVAPSGSSKTKARREKEAQERRRRLSEAAIRAVADAGGNVDKLLEQGFTF